MDMNASDVGERALKYISDANREAWLNLFADDAVIIDPAGQSEIDPTGKGNQGRLQIERFFDRLIPSSEFKLELKASIPLGNECSKQLLVNYKSLRGNDNQMNMIVVYTVNAASLINSIKVYWRFNELMKSIASGGSDESLSA